ncbi:MAG: two-component regulator propeller domain-containing protein [Paludibacter sp.]
MKTLRFYLLFSCLSVSSFSLYAQIGTFYSTDKELSNSLINAIYQDKRNYIWIATEDGLNKFDGMRFTVYKNKQGDKTTIKNNYVRALYEDSSGKFWIGCVNGLNWYNRAEDSFTEVELYNKNEKIQPHITSIIESKSHEIWITTSGQGIIHINKNSKVYQVDNQLSSKLCSRFLISVFEDSKGNFWIASENQGLNLYSPLTGEVKVFKAPESIGSNQISSICEDNKGNIFVGTLTGGLFRFNHSTFKFDAIKCENTSEILPVKSLLFDRQNRLLVGTDGRGMKIYNYKTNSLNDFQIPSMPFDFSKLKIHAIFEDKTGNIWTGLFQKGVFLSPNNPNKFNYWGFKSFERNVIGSSCVMSLLEDKNNMLWVGTDNDGIYSVNKSGHSIHYPHTNLGTSVSNTIMSMIEDNNGTIWLGSYLNGLARFEKSNGKCTYFNNKSESNATSNNRIICLAKDNKNQLWIGTNGAGAYVFDISKQAYTKHFSQSESGKFKLLGDWINSVFCDRDGIIWFGTYDGICFFDPNTNKTGSYTIKDKVIPGNIVYTINEDHKGNLWIGTTEGLACFNKKTQKSKLYTMNDGLPSNVICGILEDENGNIWLSTHMGISKLIVAENKFVNHYAFDGLQGNEFSMGAAFKSSDGQMIFGGINGVTFFYPSEINDQRAPLQLFLTGLYVLDKPVKKGKQLGGDEIINTFISDVTKIHLNYKDNMFSLEFSTFDFVNSGRIYYRYKLVDLNSKWMNTEQGVNRINFTNINYGTYKLKVMACIQDNMSPEKEFEIIISPPWYLSWWAKLLYFCLFVMIVWAIYRYVSERIKTRQEMMQREHAEQINEAKLQFFINISHEIRTPMTLIISPLEKLISENEDKELQKIYLMMYRNAQRILRLINQLMDVRKIDKGLMFMKFREIDIVCFVDDLMQIFEYQSSRRNISFRFEKELSELKVWIDLNNFDKVLLNILSNAFKFTPDGGEIVVKLKTGHDVSTERPLRNYFELIVSDTGIGIEEDKIEKIFERFYQIDNYQTNSNFGTGIGLHLSRSLVELLHGTLKARNRTDGVGSEFIIRLPLGRDHLTASEIVNDPSFIPSAFIPDTVLFEENINEEDDSKQIKPKTKYRILVVDDEEDIRHYIKKELSPIYKISECANGKEALTYILKVKPDLVICDVMMPEMDGFTLCKKLKSNININHIPIILLTAKSTDEEKAEGLDFGADAYLVKPFNVKLLKKLIANIIDNRERLEIKLSDSEENQSLIKPVVLQSYNQTLLEKIIKIINENIADPDLNVEMLASRVGMSRVHMHRKLKELTNQSARDLIKSIRLKQAAELLQNQKLTISEVGYALGFSNLSHFSNTFKEFYGVSPKEFAQKNLHISKEQES